MRGEEGEGTLPSRLPPAPSTQDTLHHAYSRDDEGKRKPETAGT